MDIRSFFGAKPKAKDNHESNNNNKKSKENKSNDSVKTDKTPRKGAKSNQSEGSSKSKDKSHKSENAKHSSPVKKTLKDDKKSPHAKHSKSRAVERRKSGETRNKKSSKDYDDDMVEIDSDEDFDCENENEHKREKKKNIREQAGGSAKKAKNQKKKDEDDDEDDSPVKAKRKPHSKGKDKKKVFSSDEEQMEVVEDFEESKKKKNLSKPKKGPIIFDSDSDSEDPLPKSAKKSKSKRQRRSAMSDSVRFRDNEQASIEEAFSKMQPKKKSEKASEKLVKPTTPAKKQMSAADFFGLETVKRSEPKPAPVKRKAVEDDFDDDFEIHDDDDFEKTLAQLDAHQPSKKVKRDSTSPKKAEKNENQPSLASKLASKKQNGDSAATKKESPIKKDKTPVKNKSPVKAKTPEKQFSPKAASEKKSPLAEDTPSGKPELKRKGTGFRSYLNREGPRALGSKEIPEGGENCLEGLTFVITGVLESMERDECKTLVERYGGKVTGNVSKKTSYVVAGRDAGESKMAKAHQFGTKELDEDGLLDLIRSLPGKKSKYQIEAEKSAKNKTPVKIEPTDPVKAVSPVKDENSVKLEQFTRTPDTKKPVIPSAKSSPAVSQSSSKAVSSPKKTTTSAKPGDTLMWVDKYKPMTLKQIIGQQGDKSNARKLMLWLQKWHANRKLNKKPAFNRFNDDGSGHRAALLSGPPGVGKTTTATIVCKEAGFSFVELNASDTRSKNSLQTEVAEALGNHTLVDFFGSNSESSKSEGEKHCLIMDEVDGMAGNEDRGGMQELIQLIKKSKIPIICMCNDRNHQKVRSLANYCFDLRFQRPRLEQIKSAMMSIAFKEGVKIPPPALNEMISAANQDVRQVLHNMSMWTAKEKNVSYDQIKKDAANAKKDLKLGPFDVCRKVFVGGEETRGMTLNDKSDLFFHDYSFGPLFVHENYITVTPFEAKGNVRKHLEQLSKAADSLTDSDLIDKQIRGKQNWSLLPLQAMYASVIPGEAMRGSMGGMVQFPQWLGRNSTTNKNQRLLQDLKTHMRLKVFSDKNGLNLEYFPQMRQRLTAPLVERGNDGVPDVIQLLGDYDLLREDFDSIIELTSWPGSKDPMSLVETKTKSAFTRAYNKEAHLTPYSTVTAAKKKAKKGAGDDEFGLEGEEGTLAVESEEEEDDNPLADGMIKAKKPAAKKTADSKSSTDKKTASSAKGKGRGKKK